MRFVPENGIGAKINRHVDPEFHCDSGFIGRGAGGGRALACGKNLAGFGVAGYECGKLFAAEKAHHCPGIRPTAEACIAGHLEKLRGATAGEDHFILAETVDDVRAVMRENIIEVAFEMMRPAVCKIGNASFRFQASGSRDFILSYHFRVPIA